MFEIIRDIGYIIQTIEEKETIWFNVTKDNERFHSFRSSKYTFTGQSETSRAIEKAYEVTRGRPDKRDIRIKELEAQLNDKAELIAEVEKLYKKTRSNPEMWDTDGICMIIDDVIKLLRG
jgi:hypothetical protein